MADASRSDISFVKMLTLAHLWQIE
jgi:hypothetical protein